MSPDAASLEPGDGTRGGETSEAPGQLESSIDAVDWLRKHMRERGMADCADALDDAFAESLKAYLDLKGQGKADPTAAKTN